MTDRAQFQENDPYFAEEIAREPGCQHLARCFSCGVCTASCPVSRVEPKFSPSRILRQIQQGRRQALLASESLWFCLRCATCSFQCPQDVRFADIMGGLRNLALREGVISPPQAASLEQLERFMQHLRLKLVSALLSPGETRDLKVLLQQCIADLDDPEGLG